MSIFRHKIKNRKWYHIIGWWEIRRIPYNIILLFSGLFSLFIFSFVVKGAGDFIHPMAIFGFAFLANFFYTGGWVVEMLYKLTGRNTNAWGINSFKAGVLFSIGCTLIPTLLFAIGGLVRGERFSSPYSHFATEQPAFHQLVGTYKINLKKADYLSEDDKKKQPQISLNADSTFTVSNFPVFGSFENYELCDGKGKWIIDKHLSFNTWTISVDYDTLTVVGSNLGKGSFITDYFIYNNKPPYMIYDIASDPDEWAGVLYEKNKE